MSELPKDKKPPESIIWDGDAEELEEWLERAFNPKEKGSNELAFSIDPKMIEG